MPEHQGTSLDSAQRPAAQRPLSHPESRSHGSLSAPGSPQSPDVSVSAGTAVPDSLASPEPYSASGCAEGATPASIVPASLPASSELPNVAPPSGEVATDPASNGASAPLEGAQ